MAIYPYRQPPTPPALALLLEDGRTVLTEDGNTLPLSEVPRGMRVWGSWDRVSVLWGDGMGEALCWMKQPVRWRPEVFGGEWRSRHNDVRVLRVTFPEDDGEALTGLSRWREWLGRYGAAPQGSLGSSAWSLLRATIQKPVFTSVGNVPPIPWIVGGRQTLVLERQGRHEPAYHYDLPAAYAAALGTLRYGGAWAQVGERYPWRMVSARGVLCFVRARVKVPDLPFGPLPRRPRKQPGRWVGGSLNPNRYPVRTTFQGVWTWEELEAAMDAGCKVKPLAVWVLSCGDDIYPFLPWWEAVQEGRTMPGFAGLLAKATGNAMWGQFAINPSGNREVIRWSGTRRAPKRHVHPAPMAGQSPHYAPDLAETLTGRVRADLFRCMLRAQGGLLCAHTDGIWTNGTVEMGGTWRQKLTVARLDMLTPQMMRYRIYKNETPTYVVAGAPDTLAPAIFEKAWEAMATEGKVPA